MDQVLEVLRKVSEFLQHIATFVLSILAAVNAAHEQMTNGPTTVNPV